MAYGTILDRREKTCSRKILNEIRQKIVFLACMLSFLFINLPVSNCNKETSTSSKVLVVSGDYSHWYNMKVLAGNLVKMGVDVSVLRPSSYLDFMEETAEFNFINFNVTTMQNGSVSKFVTNQLQSLKLGERKPSLLQTIRVATRFHWTQMNERIRQCDEIMEHREIIEELTEAKYDIVLSDPIVMCGEVIAAKLGIPIVSSIRTIMAELHFEFAQAPIPLSYVPMYDTGFTDNMTFLQRTTNTLSYIFQRTSLQFYVLCYIDPMVQKHIGIRSNQLMKRTSLWLIRTDFAFEYPRPLMPNMKFVGGLQCKPAKPLDKELEKFVNESEEDGFIVFSLGSVIRGMHRTKANTIAAVFAKLKQRVVWKYSDEKPESLGSNTKLMSWIPQNDLLGHPKCKLFMTHGGTNGIYESIYHGVPTLGFPQYADQYDNVIKVKSRGAAELMDVSDLNRTELLHTIEELIKNKKYKENAMRLSTLHRDTIVRPLDAATFWVRYVIRHKGAPHLRPAAHVLWWFQYYLIDVLVFMLTLTILWVWTMKKVTKFVIEGKYDKLGGNRPVYEKSKRE